MISQALVTSEKILYLMLHVVDLEYYLVYMIKR